MSHEPPTLHEPDDFGTDGSDWEDDQLPRRDNRRLITWVVIGALLLGPLLTLRNLYSAEPVLVLILAGIAIGVAYIAHNRRGDALTRIDKLFQKRR
jgi:hypothetical protein